METLTEPVLREQIERICDSHTFRSAPKLARLLRFLAAKTLEGGEVPLGQRLVAEHVLGGSGRVAPGSAVVVRMQVGRLRRHLESYYSTVGGGDPIRVEVPKRNYRLRFVAAADAARAVSPRSPERATLAIVEFTDLGVGTGCERLPRILTSDLIVALSPFEGVAVKGPIPPADPTGRVSGSQFSLLGDVYADRDAHLSLRLIEGRSGLQVWARSLTLPLAGGFPSPGESLAAFAGVADELADETGVIACSLMRETATKPVESLTVHEATLAAWRFLMTGAPDDLLRARAATADASHAVPDSPPALVHEAMMQYACYLADPDPRARCPRGPLELVDRAASLAPGDPWVGVHRGFALWIAGESIGLEAVCRSLDGRSASGSFRGILGSLMVVTGIDPARGAALLGESLARAPQPLYWCCHHAALAAFRRGDLDGMRAALARIAVRIDPFSLVLRMVAATVGGDQDAALRVSRTVLEVFPGFSEVGEVMLRRLLHDDHVDAIAAAVRPLGLGWFR